MTRWCSLAVLGAVLGAHLAAVADEPVGKWKTVDDESDKVESEVQLYLQDADLGQGELRIANRPAAVTIANTRGERDMTGDRRTER